ncbi:MAG TPA: hypothetical protein VFF69_01030 [Phycisphaerales bacterium]|nr:hypothetical protein [Phycisphaerales bacterium]
MQSEGVGGAVESFFAEGGDEALRFTGRGAYDPTLPKPVSLGVELAIDREAGPDGTEAAPAAGASVIPASLYGAISADFTLSGTLQPVRLDGEARMLTEGVRFREVVFEDMELLGTAEFHEGGGTFSSEEFALLEGNASLVARSDWRGNVQAEARVEGVNLETLGVIFAPEVPLKGRAGAVLTAELPGGELEDVVARAEWRVEGFATTLFEVERAVGAATYAEGVVELEETSIFNGGGEVRTRATFPLDNLSNVDASVEADRFAMQLGGVRAVVTGRSEGTLDVLNQRAEMSLAGSADFTLEEQRVATIGIDGQITGRTLELGTIEGRIGDGVLGGVAIVPLDALAESTARLTLRDLEPRYFGGLWAQTRDVAGRVNGTLVLAPTSEEHAPEPSRLDVEFALSDAAWRSVALESLSIQAYIGEERSVLHRAIARLGGGTVTLWGSTNDHDGDRYVQLSGDVRSVDLQQVVSAVAPDADRYEGRVSATFSGAGYALEPHRLFGQATVTVTDSDLIAIPVINELYSLFRASDRGDRNGAGIAEMRLDGERLYIPRADYFNRGLELRASLTVADVFRGKHSPIVGMAVGTARPLAGSELGLTERADRMLSAAQAGGTIARIDGTLSEPEAKVVALADLQNFVSRLLSPLGE